MDKKVNYKDKLEEIRAYAGNYFIDVKETMDLIEKRRKEDNILDAEAKIIDACENFVQMSAIAIKMLLVVNDIDSLMLKYCDKHL